MCENGEEAIPVCQRGSWTFTDFGLGCYCAFYVRESSRLIIESLEIGMPAVAILLLGQV